jgi:hypothetical protein
MADAGDGELGNALEETVRVPPMTRGEKFAFWAMPFCLALMAVPLLAADAYGLIIVAVAFWPNSHWYLQHPDRLKMVLEDVLGINAYAFVLVGALLVYPAFFFRKMLRRKKETGSVLPQGEELAARRRKWKNPSWRMKAWPPGFFALIASGWTYKCITAPHRLPLAVWSFPALAWVIVILVAIDCFFPRTGRLWTGICDSVAFGSLAAIYLIGAPHALRRQAAFWIFPILTGGFAIVLAFWVIRDWKRRRASALGVSAGIS